jgi:predicted ATPase with chaperone activity
MLVGPAPQRYCGRLCYVLALRGRAELGIQRDSCIFYVCTLKSSSPNVRETRTHFIVCTQPKVNVVRKVSDTTSVESTDSTLKGPSYTPSAPRKLADLKISHSVMTDLMLRHLRAHGVSSFSSLHTDIKISSPIIHVLFEEMRKQQLIEVKGLTGQDYSFDLTTAGRNLAAERSQMCNYVGPAPVSLDEYATAIKTQTATLNVNRAALRRAFADLVVPDSLLDQLGPALVSQQSLFLYGPTGNGKTSYSERLIRVYEDSVLVPYAVEVDAQIISVYDPVVHRRLSIDGRGLDPRWVVCRRPYITAGGELVASLLDLQFDRTSGTYLAPLQMKANNGILVIDDFGRQAISPRELLNRWILPLDRRVDYLSLSYGMKFEIPFELLVVFSTNLDPLDLVDDAFLRRIPNKVYVGDVEDQMFDRIFEVETAQQNIAAEAGSAEQLRRLCKLQSHGGLRACYPRDICRILLWISAYEERPVKITNAELERAVDLYFTRRPHIAGKRQEQKH